MKFSFSITRSSPSPSGPTPVVGSVIRSPVAMPQHAKILNDFQELNRKMLRGYDSAMANNFNADFQSTFGSANAEIQTSLYISRARARTLCKDDPHAKAILRTFKQNTVGHDPFRLKMRVGKYVDDGDGAARFVAEAEINRLIEQEWTLAGLPQNFSVRRDMSRMEGYQIVEASAVRDGSILARHHRAFPNNKYNYALDLLESDRLQESYMGRSAAGNMIRFSIERDQWQSPVAYWILTRHPGDSFGYTNKQIANTFRERVAAADIIHFNNLRDRAEQDIGFTELDCIVQQLHRDRQYDISLTYAAIASCCKPFWIKKEFPTGMQYTSDQLEQMQNAIGAPGGAATGAGDRNPQAGIGVKTNVVGPATTEVFDYGQSLQQLDPKFPIEAATEFKKDNMRSAAIGAGIAYQSISGDFQNMGFSASRMSELPQRDNFKIRQEHMIMNFVRQHFNEWLKNAILAGVFPGEWMIRLEEFQYAAHFQGRRWAYVNPLQDVQAEIMAEEAGYRSPQQIQGDMEDGVPLEDLYSEMEEAKTLQEAHGLCFEDPDVTQPGLELDDPDNLKTEPGEAKPEPKKGAVQTLTKRHRRSRIKLAELLLMQGDGRNGNGSHK